MNGLGKNIKRLREERDWSQKELGKRAGGINTETIVRIEGGLNTSIKKLENISIALGVKFGALLPEEQREPTSKAAPSLFKCNIESHMDAHELLEKILKKKDLAEWIRGNLIAFEKALPHYPDSEGPNFPEGDNDADLFIGGAKSPAILKKSKKVVGQ